MIEDSIIPAQWFNPLGLCKACGRNATGQLMSHRNANLGPYCKKCADRLIKKAHKSGSFWPDGAKGAA
jgi:hypothetical protein